MDLTGSLCKLYQQQSIKIHTIKYQHVQKDINYLNMVRGFDQTQNDNSKLVLDYLFGIFDRHKVNLSPKTANSLIKQWISNSKLTNWVYLQFQLLSAKPQLIVNKYCHSPLQKNEPYQGDRNFAAFQYDNQIHICLYNVKNKIELKENLDRELYTKYYLQVNRQRLNDADSKQKDKVLMQSLYYGCMKGYSNYGWQVQTQKRIGKKCAVYLFRRRTSSNLPPDSIFRYSSVLADQICI